MMKRFNDLSLRVKMSLGPAFLVLTLVGLAAYSLLLLDRYGRSLDALSNGAFKRASLVAALDAKVSGVQARLYQLTSVAANDSDAARAKAMAESLHQELGGINAAFTAMTESVAGDPALATLRDQMAKTLKDYVGSAKQVVDMSGNASYALIFMNSAQEAFDAFVKEQAALDTAVGQEKTALVEQIHDQSQHARVVFFVSTILAVLIAAGITFLLGGLVSRPVIAIAAALRRLAGGDLAIETP